MYYKTRAGIGTAAGQRVRRVRLLAPRAQTVIRGCARVEQVAVDVDVDIDALLGQLLDSFSRAVADPGIERADAELGQEPPRLFVGRIKV